jgi:hypothetical protein
MSLSFLDLVSLHLWLELWAHDGVTQGSLSLFARAIFKKMVFVFG